VDFGGAAVEIGEPDFAVGVGVADDLVDLGA